MAVPSGWPPMYASRYEGGKSIGGEDADIVTDQIARSIDVWLKKLVVT